MEERKPAIEICNNVISGATSVVVKAGKIAIAAGQSIGIGKGSQILVSRDLTRISKTRIRGRNER